MTSSHRKARPYAYTYPKLRLRVVSELIIAPSRSSLRERSVDVRGEALADSPSNSLGASMLTRHTSADAKHKTLATSAPTSEATVSELKQRIENLESKLDQAQRMATLGELLSTTTHEFNNVLMSVMNYTRMALRAKDDAKRQSHLQKVLDASDRAARISKSILGAARNRSGQFDSVDLKSLLDDTLVLMEREYRKYRVALNQEVADVPAILARGNEIQQVILNLLVNARQAVEEGGEVTIRLSHNASDGINELTIRDNGCGIPADKLPKIFDPFFTTKSGPDETGRGGTGLGLAACREIIEAHKGRIRVASTEGKGTAFTLKLPVAA